MHEPQRMHPVRAGPRSEEHTSELQSLTNLVCRLLLGNRYDIVTNVAGKAQSTPPPPLSGTVHDDTFFFNDTAPTEIYTLSLHDALPISELDRAQLSWPWTSIMWCTPTSPIVMPTS